MNGWRWMETVMERCRHVRACGAAVLLLFVAATSTAAAPEPQPADFAWHATAEPPAGTRLARVPLPAEALVRFRSPAADDLRVYAADGRAVPFAIASPPLPPASAVTTAPVAALPLQASAGATLPRGAVRVRVDGAGESTSVWIQSGRAAVTPAPAGTRRLPAAIFDTRSQADPWTALVVQGRWPSNMPIAITAATSPDLASWTPVRLQGRVYRFDGEQAPANQLLRFDAPLALREHYLRLEWPAQDDIRIEAVQGRRQTVAAVTRPVQALGPGRQEGDALQWDLPFALPMAQWQLLPQGADIVLPVRILGRAQASEPWRVLAHTVVYRLGAGDAAGTSGPVDLPRLPLRWIRVEPTHGQRFPAGGLQAQALFDPLDVLVPASSGALQLALGRPDTPAAALPVHVLAQAGEVDITTLPVARLQPGPATPLPAPSAWTRLLPEGVDTRTATLWSVLLAGVLVLGGVAVSLLRQVKATPPPEG